MKALRDWESEFGEERTNDGIGWRFLDWLKMLVLESSMF